MWRQLLPDSAAYFTEYAHKLYLHCKIIIHKVIYSDSRMDENSPSLSVRINVFSIGHMLRIIILINSKSLTWYLGEGYFIQRRKGS